MGSPVRRLGGSGPLTAAGRSRLVLTGPTGRRVAARLLAGPAPAAAGAHRGSGPDRPPGCVRCGQPGPLLCGDCRPTVTGLPVLHCRPLPASLVGVPGGVPLAAGVVLTDPRRGDRGPDAAVRALLHAYTAQGRQQAVGPLAVLLAGAVRAATTAPGRAVVLDGARSDAAHPDAAHADVADSAAAHTDAGLRVAVGAGPGSGTGSADVLLLVAVPAAAGGVRRRREGAASELAAAAARLLTAAGQPARLLRAPAAGRLPGVGAVRGADQPGAAVCVVDAMLTSGTTLRAAMRALAASGWAPRAAAVLAADPRWSAVH